MIDEMIFAFEQERTKDKMKFILAHIRIDGISYHVKLIDRESWWPQSELSDVPADARVFDANNKDDCSEAIRLMLDHDYRPLIIKNPT